MLRKILGRRVKEIHEDITKAEKTLDSAMERIVQLQSLNKVDLLREELMREINEFGYISFQTGLSQVFKTEESEEKNKNVKLQITSQCAL